MDGGTAPGPTSGTPGELFVGGGLNFDDRGCGERLDAGADLCAHDLLRAPPHAGRGGLHQQYLVGKHTVGATWQVHCGILPANTVP